MTGHKTGIALIFPAETRDVPIYFTLLPAAAQSLALPLETPAQFCYTVCIKRNRRQLRVAVQQAAGR